MTDTVFVTPKLYQATADEGVYHTDPDCKYVTENHRTASTDEVERLDVRECRICRGVTEYTGGSRALHDALVDADPDTVGGRSP